MQPKTRRAAWLQGVVLLAAVIALATTLVLRLRRPYDRDTLAIPVGTLRSQAAEATLLERQVRLDHLAPAFVRLHVRQLGRDVARTRVALADKPAAGALEPLRRQALSLADALRSRLDALGRDGRARAADGAGFAALARALDDLDRRIEPEG